MKKICSFCGRELSDNDNVIVGLDGTTNICELCVNNIKNIEFEHNATPNNNSRNIPTPREIYDYLCKYVIGQDSAKKTLSVAVYNHYKRLFSNYDRTECELEKSNIVLLGPSGSGKTLLCKTIARMIDVPFVIADATSLTQSGYVGEDVESVLSKLLQASDYNIERAEQGIVFIDEIDKLGTKGGNTSITRDVSGEGVQQALLKMLEGTIVNCPPNGGRIHPEQKLVPIDTTNILFICSGAFVGIDEVVERRNNKHAVGFNNTIYSKENTDNNDPLYDVNTHDLRGFGLIPELIGRLPIIAHTTKLTKDEMYRVLTEPRNALLKQYKTMLKLDNINIDFKKNAIETIVDVALSSDVGARGLRGIMERIMEDIMFRCDEYNGKNIVITKKDVKKILNIKD